VVVLVDVAVGVPGCGVAVIVGVVVMPVGVAVAVGPPGVAVVVPANVAVGVMVRGRVGVAVAVPAPVAVGVLVPGVGEPVAPGVGVS
jgi:hypothetical protein